MASPECIGQYGSTVIPVYVRRIIGLYAYCRTRGYKRTRGPHDSALVVGMAYAYNGARVSGQNRSRVSAGGAFQKERGGGSPLISEDITKTSLRLFLIWVRLKRKSSLDGSKSSASIGQLGRCTKSPAVFHGR
jgi:hypothetical protein